MLNNKVYIIGNKNNRIMKKKRGRKKKAVKKTIHKRKKAKKEIKKPVISLRPKREDKTLLRLLAILMACLIIYLAILMATMPPETVCKDRVREEIPPETEEHPEPESPSTVEITIA